MISTGPTATSLPVRSGADLQPSAQTQNPASVTSGMAGEAPSAIAAETTQAVDPARQTADARALPQERRNEEARLIEPSRPSAESLTRQAETPDAKTPAGPPPTFDWSVLEKARALASSQQAEPEPTPAPPPGAEIDTTAPVPGQADPSADRAETPDGPPAEVALPGQTRAERAAEASAKANEAAQSAPQPSAAAPATPATTPPGVEPA